MNLGGPVWHASGRGRTISESRQIALRFLAGVGDEDLGQWEEEGNRGVFHVRRRLSEAEQIEFGIPAVRDIRDTDEEQDRIRALLAAVPYLAGAFA